MPVTVGLRGTCELIVTEADTAIALRSGSVPVLGTPRVVALAEEASVAAVSDVLEEGVTTVAMQVQLDHVAPTAVGHRVVAESTVERVNGRRVTFTVSLNDDRGLVAVGRLTRVVVDVDRFLEKVE